MTALDSTRLRAEHDAMVSRLSSRKSTVHFAHSAVSLFAAIIQLGTTGKLWWDFGERHAEWTELLGAAGVLTLGYAAWRYFAGRRVLASELVDLEKLHELRRTLHLDDPSALLP